MKYLTIVRHGKAVSPDRYDRDFDRPLARRGEKDTPRMAGVLNQLQLPPDYIVSSPAVRAWQTAELLAVTWERQNNLHADERIYDAPAPTLLEVLRSIPDSVDHGALVGHNPGLEELISGLCNGGTGRLNLRLPTAGLAHVCIEVFEWQQLRWGCGQLHLLVAPKCLPR